MERTKMVRIALIVFAIIFFIMSAIMLMQGNNKMTKYYNSEKYPSNNVNAYVGGDAYNYIINGNYATGYFVLAMGFMLAGIICLGTNAIVFSINNHTVTTPIVVSEDQNGKEEYNYSSYTTNDSGFTSSKSENDSTKKEVPTYPPIDTCAKNYSNSEQAYIAAYLAHYKRKNYQEAYKLYSTIVRDFPDSKEAKYSLQQIENIKSIIDVSSIDVEEN